MPSNKHLPPKWADKFLEWYCKPELLEEIQGDAYELFAKRIEDKGLKFARRHYSWDVLRSFRLSTIRNQNLKLSPAMFKNNFKIAFRHLFKQKMYSAIKIGGFSLGIAACLLIALYIKNEVSYDMHYENIDQIYRVIWVSNEDGKIEKDVFFSAPFAKTLKDEFPEVELAGRYLNSELFGAGSKEVRRSDKLQNNYETGFAYADQELLDLLEIPIIDGDSKNALTVPKTIVISKSKADKYFPNESPVGEILILNNDEAQSFEIGGVMADFPKNSHIHYDFLMTMSGVEFWPGEQNFWRAGNYPTYVRLRPDAQVQELEFKLINTLRKYRIASMKAAGVRDADERMDKVSVELQPISEIHLRSADIDDELSHGDIRFVWLFGAIAGFILLIACINFINLSTARSANRAKEVGLRKVLGSYRRHLVSQFLTESVLFSVLSFAMGLLLAWALLPYFNQLAGKSLAFPWHSWWLLPVLISAAVGIGLLAGVYPSWYLSGFQPIKVLKGQVGLRSKNVSMRNALVVVQFTTSIVLIIATFIIYQQMNYLLDKKVGFDKEQVVIFQATATMDTKIETFKKELLKLPQTISATISDYLPITGTSRNYNGFWQKSELGEENTVSVQKWVVDHDYIKTLGMNIVQGRDFALDMPTDSQAVIINETFAKKLGLENPIGIRITNSRFTAEVIGVVEDFHFESMKEEIDGLCLQLGSDPAIMSVKVNAEHMDDFIQSATRVWDKFAPNQSLRYIFLDESFALMYADVQRMGRIFTSFAILAIIVACLGLFALSAYMAEQRAKEMSIRKILGASVNSLFHILTRDFLALVFIALLIAIPLGWYLMRKWLQDYEYQVEIGWQVFAFAGIIALSIAIVTISFQALRAATDNPIKALSQE